MAVSESESLSRGTGQTNVLFSSTPVIGKTLGRPGQGVIRPMSQHEVQIMWLAKYKA